MPSPLVRSPLRLTSAFLAAFLLLHPPELAGQAGEAGEAEQPGMPDSPDPVTGSHEVTAPRATAVRTSQPFTIDGRLEEAAWMSAPAIREFTQTDPDEGAPVSQPTEVRILYDDNAIYVGAILTDDGEVTSRLARRDALGESDIFSITFDSYHDHQTGYRFAINPAGVKRDELVSTGGSDASWDPVWDGATSRTEDGWVVEMRIPFSQLRFTREPQQVWGMQIERSIHRNQESAQFAFTPKLERGGVQRYGHLYGISDILPGRRLELLPYVATRAEYVPVTRSGTVPFEDPYRSGSDYFANAGLDLKYRIRSNVTLDATVNPDFGQVEVDPAVINLTAFETRFDERRPFFVEGAEIFRFGQGGPTGTTGRAAEVFYSRRIGRTPQGSVPASAVYADEPPATTILGAAKLTAKLGDGWSIGILEAVTASEQARFTMLDGTAGKLEVEPSSNYFIGRVRRDSRNGRTRIGALFTALNRRLEEPALAQRLHSAAYVAGVDLIHEWAEGSWRLSGSLSPSVVLGESEAIQRTQQSSSRYYNRPDASHLDLDPNATRLAGYYAMAELNKVAGTWTGRVALGATSPGYEVNDVGFQTYADRLIVDTHFQYSQVRPGRYLRNWNIGGGPDNIWNYAGQHVLSNINLQGRYQWMNYWSTGWRFEYTPEVDDDRLTRGGPISRAPSSYMLNLNAGSDSRRPHTVNGSVTFSGDAAGGRSTSGNLNVNLRPRENWDIQIGPRLTRSHNAAQYVTRIADDRALNTFGSRYIFAPLDQTTFSIDTRVNVTFSPTLSFQLYAQPLISSGDYGHLMELQRAGAFEFDVYGEDLGSIVRDDAGAFRIDPVGNDPGRAFTVRDQNFDVRSVIGNAVLRWEWRPGSTLYLVWQQSRVGRITGMDPVADGRAVGRFDLGASARALLDIEPDNIFAVKINYWLNP